MWALFAFLSAIFAAMITAGTLLWCCEESAVSTLKELGIAYEDTLEKIQEKFELTEARAKETMQNYW